MAILKEILTFAKAQTSAAGATCVDYATRIVFDMIIGLTYVQATFLGALVGGLVNCCINYRWVFDTNDCSKRSVTWRYFVVWTGSIIFNTVGTAFFKEVVHLKAYTSMIVTSALVAVCWNYMMQRSFVFRNKKIQPQTIEED